HVGLLDEALQELRINLDIDPTDLFPLERIAGIHWAQQQLDTALAEFERLPGEYGSRALILYSLGRRAEALDVPGQGATEPDTPFRASVLAVLLAADGRPSEARQQIRIAEKGESLSHFHHAAYNIAGAYALMGDPVTAVRWLRRTADEGFPCYPLFAKDRTLDPLRRDPPFIQLMADVKQHWERFSTLRWRPAIPAHASH